MSNGDAAAVRIDEELGFEERVGYFVSGGDHVIGTSSRPTGAVTSGLVLCSSIGNEVVKNYRREVLLGRALAARGTFVQRFHYRGYGNSDGDPAAVTFDSLVEDARTAAAIVRDAVGDGPIGFMGTRFGALVAAAAASGFPGAPLVLAEPVLKAPAFFKEGFRAVLMQRITARDGGRTTTEQLIEQLRRDGELDLLGSPLRRALYESAATRDVLQELGDGRRPVLLVRMGDSQSARKSADQATSGWAEHGLDVEVRVVGAQETWWYLDERELVDIGGEPSANGDGADAAGPVPAVEQQRRDEPVGTAGLIREILAWLDRTLVTAEAG
jgi:pimeloyl-ACP methyl ester carboxylesterase